MGEEVWFFNQSGFVDLEHPGKSLGEFMLESLKKNASSCSIPAQIECETGESTSFSELLQASVQAALGLRKLGLKRGDTIAFFSRNKSEIFPVLIGSVFEGITMVFLIPSSTEDEVRHFFSLTRPSAVLSEPQFNSHVALRVAAPGTLHLVTGPSGSGPHSPSPPSPAAVTLRALLSSGSKANPDTYRPVPIPDLHEHLAFIEFSSGTSGMPKAVGLNNYGFVCACLDPKKMWSVIPGERLLVTSALSWTTGLTMTVISIINGTTRLVANYKGEQDIANIIQTYKANCWFIAPARLILLADSVLDMSPRPDLSSLRAVVTGGGALSADKQRHISRRLGAPVLQVYGCTEAGLITADTIPPRCGSSGKPLPGVRLRIVDISTGNDVLEPRALGEVRVKSAFYMKEYVGSPEATAKAFDEHGYYYTGDLGYIDEDGCLFIVDRIKELLKYNSMEMAPAEIEGVLLSHPDVKEACVVGRPHPRLGDLPTAFVVRVPGTSVSAQDLQKLVADRLSEFKRLRGGVYFEEELQKTSNGKLDRREFKMRLIREEDFQSRSL